MPETIAIYTDRAGLRRKVELVSHPDGGLVVDRGLADVRIVACLEGDEGRNQAIAVLEAGGYLVRARECERPLCREPSAEEQAALEAARPTTRPEAGGRELSRAA